MQNPQRSQLPYLWLFLSGVIALSYEVLWIHYFRLLLGNTVYSFSWTSGVFLLGISFGTLLSHSFIKKDSKNLLKTYMKLELGITLLASASFLTLLNTPTFIINFLSPHSLIKDGLVAFLFIFPVTTLMGITFPVLVEQFNSDYELEKLYGMNTIGGGLGILGLGFFAVILFGYRGTLILTLLLNLTLFLWVLSQKGGFEEKAVEKSDNESLKIPVNIALISFLSGFILLGLEVVWFKSMEIILNDRAYISTLILFVVLTSLGFASWYTPQVFKKDLKPLSILIPLSILSLLFAELLGPEVFFVSRDYSRVSAIKTTYVIFTFLVPLLLLGFTFPGILNTKKWDGISTAKLLLFNTIGGMAGTLIVSYGIISWLGMKSFYVISIALLIVVLGVLPKSRFKIPSLIVSLFLLAIFIKNYQTKVYIHRKDQVISTNESPYGIFSLIRREGKLEIYTGNYRIVSPYGGSDVTHAQNALAYYPGLFAPSSQNILSIGTGYGISLGAFLTLEPEKLTSVEILKEVNDISYHFKDSNREWYKDPRVVKVVDDGRSFLKRTNEKFDVISSNISSPYTTAGSMFLTKQYFEDVKKHLKPKGIYSQLIWGKHLAEVVHTFTQVFPHYLAIPGYENSDLVIIGSKVPLELKHEINYFDKEWPLYKNMSRADTFKLGQEILDSNLKKKPEFIVDDHFAYLTHNWTRGLKFFWIHGP